MSVLLPRSSLDASTGRINEATNDAVARAGLSSDDARTMAFRIYYVFEHRLFTAVGLPTMDSAESFYNAYYWFKTFVAEQRALHGPDAALEQQAYQMLEHAPAEADWDQVRLVCEQLEREEALRTR